MIHSSLLKYSKSSCGVDFLLNTAESTEKRYRTDFSEPNHLMRFFKQMTGQTISEFLAEMNREE